MDKKRKQQLLAEYKERKPEMGIIAFTCIPTGECFIDATMDTKALINRYTFQLGAGSNPSKELQKLWNQYGSEKFKVEVIEVLPYDEENVMEQDYTKELQQLLEQKILKLKNTRRIKNEYKR